MPITVSGTAITFNDATTQTTAFTGGAGTVTSVATGNGLQGGTITTSGTLSVACPTFDTVGSYVFGMQTGTATGGTPAAGGTIAAGGGNGQLSSANGASENSGAEMQFTGVTNNLSGTWRNMGRGNPLSPSSVNWMLSLFCRVS
jgi:hypothetical protein